MHLHSRLAPQHGRTGHLLVKLSGRRSGPGAEHAIYRERVRDYEAEVFVQTWQSINAEEARAVNRGAAVTVIEKDSTKCLV